MSNLLRASAARAGLLSARAAGRFGLVNVPCTATACHMRFFSEEPKPVGTSYEELTVGVPKERFPLEKRVAATPESVQRLVKPGFNVVMEAGAGEASHFSDADYEAAGAKIVSKDDVWKESDIVMKVRKEEDRRN